MTQKDNLQQLRHQIGLMVQEYAQQALKPQTFFPGVTAIPPSGKKIDGTEMQYMVEAALDGWLTTGRFTAAFEKQLAASKKPV